MIDLEPGWLKNLGEEFEKPYMKSLKSFLVEEKRAGISIYPRGNSIFKAFNLTPFECVKVVILGQDPYHGPNQANGLSFSVSEEIPLPPSLKNIFKELASDLSVKEPKSGILDPWAKQGVLLLNASLTVRAHSAGSHQGKGWEIFTNKAIEVLSLYRSDLVFILWGNSAILKSNLIDVPKHFIISSVHPSPLSAHRGFFGSKPFSQANKFLTGRGLSPIDWKLE